MLKIKLLAAQGTPSSVFEAADRRIGKLISQGDYVYSEDHPDILFFLTGGSEQLAIKQVSPGQFYLLVGSQHDNSYASATEVKAYLNEHRISSLLLDEEEGETSLILHSFVTIKKALNILKGKRLGLIGKVSDWLIASSVPPDLLAERFGVELVPVSWDELPSYSGFTPSGTLLNMFSGDQPLDLVETARVYELLSYVIRERGLDAITVECFPMVRNHAVTACLPLAKFNQDGIPAGCEGDLTAIAGMMLCRELTGLIPWIANINKATEEVCMFSHCTIAPGLVSDLTVKTHFETGLGTAIQGRFKEDTVTIFRFDRTLGKAFIASAEVTGRPAFSTACRTQIEVKLSREEVRLLKQFPLGNHHLILPGDSRQLLQMACFMLGISVQNGSDFQ